MVILRIASFLERYKNITREPVTLLMSERDWDHFHFASSGWR